MSRLYSAILIASVSMVQAAMVPQTSDRFKTFKEVSNPICNKSIFKGFMLGMVQQAAFFSVCHAVKGPYALGAYNGSNFVTGYAALKYVSNNITQATALERIDEESARMVHKHMLPLLNRFHEKKMQQKFVTFLSIYKAVRQGTLSEAEFTSCDGSMICDAYNDLLTQYAKRTFQGFGYVLSAVCGPAAALIFLTCCTFGRLPCSTEGYEI